MLTDRKLNSEWKFSKDQNYSKVIEIEKIFVQILDNCQWYSDLDVVYYINQT